MFWIILGILVVTLMFLYWKLTDPHKHFLRINVKQQKNTTFLLGDTARMLLRKESFPEMITNEYNRFPNERYSGMYQILSPSLVIRDPELIKLITVKDFDHFLDHKGLLPDGADALLTKNLFVLRGETWRHMRATLSPAFTSSKMKYMFHLISECAEQFVKHFENKTEDIITVEMKEITTRYASDVIATCAFGLQSDSLKERENPFYRMGRDMTNFTAWKKIKMFTFILMPNLANALGFTLFTKQQSDFFYDLVKNTIKTREEQHIIRPDMIHLLMEARKGRMQYSEDKETVKDTGFATVEESDVGKTAVKSDKAVLTDGEITAQAFIFFLAGFDTISTLMSFLAHELAVNTDCQDRLIEEIDEYLKGTGGKVTYEVISKLKYLDMVVTECLRKWPPAVMGDRVCVKPYTIEPVNPGEMPVPVNIGDHLVIPTFGIHHDPQYYPNPEKFDPERFNDANKDSIRPYTYLPFGTGPRNCIGSRFALLEAKTVFVHMLSKFKFVPVEKTDIPLVMSRSQFSLIPENGFWLGLKKRTI